MLLFFRLLCMIGSLFTKPQTPVYLSISMLYFGLFPAVACGCYRHYTVWYSLVLILGRVGIFQKPPAESEDM